VGEISDIRSLKPEEFLASGRIPVILETTKRLVISLGREAAMVGVVSGPCALARTLQSHSPLFEDARTQEHISLVGTLITKLVRALSELKVDSVFFREDTIGERIWEEIESYRDLYTATYRTLFNIVRFYNAYPVLVVRDIHLEKFQRLCEVLKPSGAVILGKGLGKNDLEFLKGLSDSLRVSLGLPLPLEWDDKERLGEQFGMMESFFRGCGPNGFFYASDGEIPSDVPFENVHNLLRVVRT
jgi:hypothetical protein